MDDDQALTAKNYSGRNFWKYMNTLRDLAEEATDNEPLIYYIDAEQMRAALAKS